MSDFKLNTYVHAVELDQAGNQTGRSQTFGPDDDMTSKDNEWALSAITNPDVWDGDAPAPVRRPEPQTEEDRLRARIAELEEEKRQAAASQPDGGGEEGDGYDELKADELRAELERRELPTSGNKPELIARLRTDDEAESK